MRQFLTLTIFSICLSAAAQEPNDMIELLRTDLRNEREPIIYAALALSEAEHAAFQPLFEAYSGEQRLLWDERLQLLDDYTKAGMELSDAKATSLLDRLFVIEQKDLDLRMKYAKQMRKLLPGTKVARWVQVERRLGQLLELQVANEVIQLPGTR